MNNIYEDEYTELLAFVKEKLANYRLDTVSASDYYNELSNIEAKVDSDGNYALGIDLLCNLLAKLDDDMEQLISNVETSIDRIYGPEVVKKNKAISALKKKMRQLSENIKEINHDNEVAKARILAYLLSLTIFIGLPITTFLNTRKKNDYEVIYPTRKITYSSAFKYNQEDRQQFLYGMPIVNCLEYRLDYEPFNYIGEDGYLLEADGYHNTYYEIIEKAPWERRGNEAIRKVRVCTIPFNLIGSVINPNDIEKLFDTYGTVKKNEVVLANEISRSDRAFYSKEINEGKNIYEIIRYDQALNTPVAKYLAHDYTDLMIIIFSELLIWLCIVECTNMLMVEGIINSISEILNNNKLTAIQRKKLNTLYDQYNSLTGKNIKKKKK